VDDLMSFLLDGQMPPKHELKPFKIDRLVKYFGSSGRYRAIDKRSPEKSCEHNDRYVSRQGIGFQRYDCLISKRLACCIGSNPLARIRHASDFEAWHRRRFIALWIAAGVIFKSLAA